MMRSSSGARSGPQRRTSMVFRPVAIRVPPGETMESARTLSPSRHAKLAGGEAVPDPLGGDSRLGRVLADYVPGLGVEHAVEAFVIVQDLPFRPLPRPRRADVERRPEQDEIQRDFPQYPLRRGEEAGWNREIEQDVVVRPRHRSRGG